MGILNSKGNARAARKLIEDNAGKPVMEFAAEQRAKGAVLVAVTLNVASDQLLVCGPYIAIGDEELKDATFWAKTPETTALRAPMDAHEEVSRVYRKAIDALRPNNTEWA